MYGRPLGYWPQVVEACHIINPRRHTHSSLVAPSLSLGCLPAPTSIYLPVPFHASLNLHLPPSSSLKDSLNFKQFWSLILHLFSYANTLLYSVLVPAFKQQTQHRASIRDIFDEVLSSSQQQSFRIKTPSRPVRRRRFPQRVRPWQILLVTGSGILRMLASGLL